MRRKGAKRPPRRRSRSAQRLDGDRRASTPCGYPPALHRLWHETGGSICAPHLAPARRVRRSAVLRSPMPPAPPSVRPGRASSRPTSSPPGAPSSRMRSGTSGWSRRCARSADGVRRPPCSWAKAMPSSRGLDCSFPAGAVLGRPRASRSALRPPSTFLAALPGGPPSERTKAESSSRTASDRCTGGARRRVSRCRCWHPTRSQSHSTIRGSGPPRPFPVAPSGRREFLLRASLPRRSTRSDLHGTRAQAGTR